MSDIAELRFLFRQGGRIRGITTDKELAERLGATSYMRDRMTQLVEYEVEIPRFLARTEEDNPDAEPIVNPAFAEAEELMAQRPSFPSGIVHA